MGCLLCALKQTFSNTVFMSAKCQMRTSTQASSAARDNRYLRLALQFVGDLPTIFGELDHHLFVQPYVHFCRVLHISLIMEFLSQTLARCSAAVQIEKLHQIDDRGSPLSFCFFCFASPSRTEQRQRLPASRVWQSHSLAQVAPAVPSLLEEVAPAGPSRPELLKPNGQRWRT